MEASADQLNVLVIDDDPGTRALLVDVVLSRGHQAVPAGSAEEGLHLLVSWSFQVAFLDQRLPGMEGLLLGEYLRRNNPDMMIALVTGEDDCRLARVAKDLSIRFIAKPFDVQLIHDVLDDTLSAAKKRDELSQQHAEAEFAPLFSEHAATLAEAYEIPGVPERIERRLAETIKRRLSDLRSMGRYTEQGRVVALSGLLTARVLGLDLRKFSPSGTSLFAEYDEIMGERGRRKEFDEQSDD